MLYDYNKVPRETVVWACAYETAYNGKGMCFKKQPVRGKVIGSKFYELKKGSLTEVKHTGKVAAYTRKYADTLEECVDLYNSMVDKHIEYIEGLLGKVKEEKINLVGYERTDS